MNKHAGTIVMSTALTATVMALAATGASTVTAAVGPGRPQPTPAPRTETTFHPNYDHALSVGQMSAAWQAELDRLFPQPVTGGG
jgi:hypothetical protein